MARLAFYTQTYNSEKYVAKAIESVLNQTFTDFVYYIVDDASSDGTVDIIKEYAKKDNRIIAYFSPENKRVLLYNEFLGKITQSDTEFLCWLDNDDWYEPEFAKKMILAMDEFTADLAICATVHLDENTMSIISRSLDMTKLIKREEYGEYFGRIYNFLRPVWGKVYRLSIIKNNKIRLKTDLAIGADTAFVLDYMRYATSVYFDGEVLHNYLTRSRSGSRTFRPVILESSFMLQKFTTSWIRDMNADTLQNREFLSAVFLNSTGYSIKVLMLSDLSIAEKAAHFCDIYTKSEVSEEFLLLSKSQQTGLREWYQEHRVWLWEMVSPLLSGDRPKKIVQMLIDQDAVMSEVKNNHELIKKPQVVNLMLLRDYSAVSAAIHTEIMSEIDKDADLALALMDLCQYVAAYEEDAGLFVFSKKAMLEVFLNREDKENFDMLADELDEMIPDDIDVAKMRRLWEGD